MKKGTRKNSNRIFRSFLLSHLLIGGIVLLLLSFFMIYSLKKYSDDVISFQNHLLSERKKEIDLKLQNLEDVSEILSDETNIVEAGYFTDELVQERIYFSELKPFLMSCDQILKSDGSVCLYYIKSNSVMAMNRRYNSQTLDSFSTYYFSLTKDSFQDFVLKKPGYYILNADTASPKLIFLSPIIDRENAVNLGKVLVQVSLPSLIKEIMHDKIDSKTLFYITYNEDVLCIRANEYGNFYFSQNELEGVTSLSSGNMTISDERYYLIDTLSEHVGWHYKIAIPERILTSRARFYTILFISALLAAGALSVILALRAARRYYTPAEKLLKALDVSGAESYTKALTSAERSALQYREQLISKNRELNQFEEYKKEEALKSLCDGLLSEKETINLLKEYGYSTEIHRESDFRVLLFYVTNIQESVFFKDGVTDYNLLQFVMKNIFSELLYENPLENAPIAFFNPQNCVALIEKISEEDLYQRMTEMKPFFNETLRLKVSTCISDPGRNILDIPEFYQQVYDLREYKRFWGSSQNDILFYSDVEDITPYAYEDTSHKKLDNLIAVGNYADARTELENILDHSFSKSLSSLPMERLQIYSLINELAVYFNSEEEATPIAPMIDEESESGYKPPEAGDEISASGLNLRMDNNSAIMKILSDLPRYQTFTELKDAVLNLFDSMVESQETEDHKDDTPSWVREVKQYVEKNYDNPSLNIAALADEYKLTPAYLSRTYKKYTNTGLLDYIHLIRVAQAKKLLDEGTTVHDAAISVGYTETRALIRYFKRYEGITPGQYQEKG